jgi:hypothetical protein
MRKSPTYSFALALAAVLALALLFPSAPSSAKGPKGPKPIPQDCVDQCALLLQQCFQENGADDNHCISIYRSCIARCK